MNRNIVLLKNFEDYVITVQADSAFEPLVHEGDVVKAGDELYKVEGMKIEESHYLPDELGIKKEKGRDFMCRLESEYVVKGEMIAEKFMATGLASKRVLAGHDGILSFDRIDKGYLDILSESEVRIFNAPISGVVTFVDPMDHIDIVPEMLVLTPFAVNSASTAVASTASKQYKQYYEFVVIKDGSSIYTSNDLSGDYREKVVFVGQFLHPELAKKLFELGARALVTFSMDYQDFNDAAGTILILGGYGHVQMDRKFVSFIHDLSGSLVCLDERIGEGNLGIINPSFSWPFSKSNRMYDPLKIEQEVISVDINSYMRIGKVMSFEQNGEYVLVDFGKGDRHLIKAENLRNIVIS